MAEYPYLTLLRSGDLLCVNCLIAVKKHCSEAASEDAGPSGLSSQECALPTYSSTQDSDSSSDSDSPAGSPALHKINKMLSSQEVSPIRKRYVHSQRYVEEKCRRLMKLVKQLLPLIFYTFLIHTFDCNIIATSNSLKKVVYIIKKSFHLYGCIRM